MSYRSIDPKTLDWRQIYRLLVGSIVPRPIAWVSTVSREGQTNIAPFSFFTCVSHHPPMVSLSVGVREGQYKHTTRNILDTGGFVVNTVVNGLEEQMNTCSGDFPAEVSEFDEAGLTPVPSDLVKAPRIGEAPVAMECELRHLLTFSEASIHPTHLVIGEIVRWHVREDVTIEEGKYIDPIKLQPVGRLAGNHYCRTQDVFAMQRPDRKPEQLAP